MSVRTVDCERSSHLRTERNQPLPFGRLAIDWFCQCALRHRTPLHTFRRCQWRASLLPARSSCTTAQRAKGYGKSSASTPRLAHGYQGSSPRQALPAKRSTSTSSRCLTGRQRRRRLLCCDATAPRAKHGTMMRQESGLRLHEPSRLSSRSPVRWRLRMPLASSTGTERHP